MRDMDINPLFFPREEKEPKLWHRERPLAPLNLPSFNQLNKQIDVCPIVHDLKIFSRRGCY